MAKTVQKIQRVRTVRRLTRRSFTLYRARARSRATVVILRVAHRCLLQTGMLTFTGWGTPSHLSPLLGSFL